MVVLRFLASLFLLIATVALVSDVTRATTGQAPAFTATAVGKHLADAAPATLNLARGAVSRSSVPWMWEALIAPLLRVPTFVLFGLLAALCGYAGRRRRRIDIFTN
jgi:hypothetical protein